MMEGAGQVDSPYNAALSGTYDFDPGTILRTFYHSDSIGNSNYSHVANPELDDLLDQGLATADVDERAAIYSQIQAIIMENAFVVPLYGNVALFGNRSVVQNLIFDPNAHPVLFDVFIEGA
jgi:peptide/nickel transport system substrate-binding protein